MKKVLIFGATGDVGVYLTDYLVSALPADDYEIIAVGRRKTSYFDRFSIKYISLDISKESDYSRLPEENVFAIIHLAGILPATMKGYDPVQYVDINIRGTLLMLEYARRVHADRFIFANSIADYSGYYGKIELFGADMPRNINYTTDHSVYSIAKVACIELMKQYREAYGIKNYAVRFPNIYMYTPNRYYYVDGERRLISHRYLIDRACAGEPIEIWGDPMKGNDMVSVKDLVRLLGMIVMSTDTDGGEYNVGSGKITTLEDQVKGMIQVFSPKDHPSEIIYRPEKRSAINILMDISKSTRDFGYEPKYDYMSYLLDYKNEMQGNRFEGL